MEEIERALERGETLLWSGKAAQGTTALDATNKKSFFTRILVAIACFAVILVLYILTIRNTTGVIKAPHILVIALCCAFIPLRMFLDMNALRKTKYAVTDRRLISVSDRVLSVTYDRIPEAVFRTDDDGHVSLLCGKKAVGMPPRKWRVAAIRENCAEDENAAGDCDSFVLYAPSDPAGLKKALKGRLSPAER